LERQIDRGPAPGPKRLLCLRQECRLGGEGLLESAAQLGPRAVEGEAACADDDGALVDRRCVSGVALNRERGAAAEGDARAIE
jgi:hypothetical protein